MAYIPDNPRWFLTSLIEEIRVEGTKRNVVHINHLLVEASSSDEAYDRALELGQESATEYINAQGRKVSIRFRGLCNLDVIHDALAHGCEIMFREKLGVSESGIQKLIRAKDQLEAFRPALRRRGRPDYASQKVTEEVQRRISTRAKNA